jgi:TonB family protein
MKYVISFFAAILFVSSSVFAQTQNTAPVVWERYKDSGKKVSFNLPKLPTVLGGGDVCAVEEVTTYRAYAEGAAYEVAVWSSGKSSRPQGCTRARNKFDKRAFEEHVNDVQSEKKFDGRSTTTVAGLEGFRLTAAQATRVVLSDDANKRWIELEVMHYPDAVPDLDRFFGSLQLGDASGKEIGNGALVTLGDEGTPIVPVIPTPTDGGKPVSANAHAGSGPGAAGGSGSAAPIKTGPSYMRVAKEKARYTDEARRANVQGTVRLKVTLLANGAVGSVVVVKDLSHGLTENAIYAARRLVFLPKRVEGKPVTVTVTVEYGFSIY